MSIDDWETWAEWDAYQVGVSTERERIIDILENIPAGSGVMGDDVSLAIEIIRGDK